MKQKYPRKVLERLPKIAEILKDANDANGGHIFHRTIDACENAFTPIDKMTPKQLETFENNLIRGFRTSGWIL